MPELITEESKDAISKAKEAAEAVEVSRSAQMKTMLDDSESRTVSTLSKTLTKVFGDFETAGRFIDLKKIPLICAQITQIHLDIGTTNKNVESLLDNQRWAVRIIIGAVIAALLALVLKH